MHRLNLLREHPYRHRVILFVGVVSILITAAVDRTFGVRSGVLLTLSAALFLLYLRLDSGVSDEWTLLTELFVVGFVLRVGVTVGLHMYSISRGDHGFFDIAYDQLNDRWAWYLTQEWRQGRYPSIMQVVGDPHVGYQAFVGLIYGLVGHSLITAKLLNSVIGAVVPILVYAICTEMFDRRTAKVSAVLTVIYPELLFWSACVLKEVLLTFLVCFIILEAIKLTKRFRVRGWALLGLSLLFLITARSYVGFVFGLSVLAFLLVSGTAKHRYMTAAMLVGIALVVLSGFALLVDGNGSYVSKVWRVIRIYAAALHVKSTFLFWVRPDGSILERIRLFVERLFLVVFNPCWIFPEYSSTYQKFLYPGTVFWYLLFPFTAYGGYRIWTSCRRASILVLLPVVSLILMYTFVLPVSGVSQRAQITPLFLISASVGGSRVLDYFKGRSWVARRVWHTMSSYWEQG